MATLSFSLFLSHSTLHLEEENPSSTNYFHHTISEICTNKWVPYKFFKVIIRCPSKSEKFVVHEYVRIFPFFFNANTCFHPLCPGQRYAVRGTQDDAVNACTAASEKIQQFFSIFLFAKMEF